MGIPYAIIRPTHVFSEGDLLLNNMAWALRRFPVFSLFGNGDCKVQPIHAEDLAAQAVDVGSGRDSFVADAAGLETFTFEELLRLLASSVGARVRLVHTQPSLGFALTRRVSLLLRDPWPKPRYPLPYILVCNASECPLYNNLERGVGVKITCVAERTRNACRGGIRPQDSRFV